MILDLHLVSVISPPPPVSSHILCISTGIIYQRFSSESEFVNVKKEPWNWFQGIDSASLSSPAESILGLPKRLQIRARWQVGTTTLFLLGS